MAIVDITGFERSRRIERERKEKEAKVEQNIEQTNDEVVVDENVEPTAVKSIDEMTKNEIMAKLDELNVEYNPRDNKETLKGLLVDANK